MYTSVHELEEATDIQVAPVILGAFFPSVFARYSHKIQGPIPSRIQE